MSAGRSTRRKQTPDEMPKTQPDTDSAANPAADQPTAETHQPRITSRTARSALALHQHPSHSMDNRPVDPSPIQISHTVRMAGQRPIGVSNHKNGVNFSQSPSIMNRPIAPNSTPEDDSLIEYLD